ncbi:Mitochondrial chaperone Frataxin [Lambiella insularis]|nr:Mitochondrial chaperone Frataxin [Lambiella insularis]
MSTGVPSTRLGPTIPSILHSYCVRTTPLHPLATFQRKCARLFSTTRAETQKSYEGVKEPTSVSQEQYNRLSDDYLERVQQWLEDLSDSDESVEVEFSVRMALIQRKAGVLTVTMPPRGTYVINKQPPNKQIWLSSPVSGPKRYDYVSLQRDGHNGEWVYLRDGSTMSKLLKEEMGVELSS